VKSFTQIAWCDEAERGLRRAIIDDEIMQIVAEEVRSGLSILWRCVSDHHFAYCVTRQDSNPDELCIVAFEGSGVVDFAEFFIGSAHAKGIPVRCHVVKRSLARLYRRVKLQESEIILRSYPNEQRRQR
jgi:hypothetical protein